MLEYPACGIKRYYSWILSLLHKHQHHRRAIQQIHSHFTVSNVSINGVLVVWNSVLKHYSLSAFPQDTLFLLKYLKTQSYPIDFDSFTYSYSIKACANMERSHIGSQLHCLTYRAGFDHHVHVQTALVNMYIDCGCLIDAKKTFDEMPVKNLVTWNVLVTGFVKLGDVDSARAIFDTMTEKNVVSWTGLIDGYTRVNRYYEAISLFRRMVVDEGIKPSEVTLLAIFPSIWNAGSIELCQMVHAYGEKIGFNASDIRIMNCLIDTYAKCGSISSSWRVFRDIDVLKRNLVSWTSIISGFAMHGLAKEAFNCYTKMERAGVKPNGITFLSVLSACSRSGLVDEGIEFYTKMVNVYGIVPTIKHYGTLIDMLGRAGRLEEAERMALNIHSGVDNVIVIWRTLLGACSFYGNVEMGERITRRMMGMERKYGGDYVLLANIFCGAGRFVDSEHVRSIMLERNAARVPGTALISNVC